MNFKPLTEYIDGHILKDLGVPSCDVRVMQGHKELFRHFVGHSDAERSVALDGNEAYDIYSCSKPITCAAALQLAERGLLDIDAPVYRHLPEYKNSFVVKDGERVTVGEKMTVRHLFIMGAGFDYDIHKPDTRKLIASNPNASTLEIVNSFIKTSLCFEPGERFNYSLCHDVLGAIIEVVSGMRFSEYLKKNIWEPLGMNRTSFGYSKKTMGVKCARYNYREGEMTLDTAENCFSFTKNYESGGAGITTCVHDYSLFADAMANGGVGASGARILRSETIDMMRTEQLSRYLKDPTFIFDDYGYGLGVRTQLEKCNGSKSPVGEFGWDGAAGCYAMMDPENGISLFAAMNVHGWPNLMNGREVHCALRDLTYTALGM